MTQVITGAVAALFAQPGEAWEGGVLQQAVPQTEIANGMVADVASLAAVYNEVSANGNPAQIARAVATFEQQAMDAPLGMPTRLAWLASAMGANVVLDLGEEPVLPRIGSSLWGPYNPSTGRAESGLYTVQQPEFPHLPPHLVADLPATKTHRPLPFLAHGAASLSVGQLVKVVPLGVLAHSS